MTEEEAKPPRMMTDADLAARLETIAAAVLPWNNSYGKQDSVRRLLKMIETLSAGEFAELRTSLYGPKQEDGEVGPLEPLKDRLWRLHRRLENDGLYVDANIVWLAYERLSKREAA